MTQFHKNVSPLLLSATTLLLFGALITTPALAKDVKAPVAKTEKWIMAEATELKESEMATIRAGFFDPSGFIFRFAVDIKTQIDGALTYVRSMVLVPELGKGFMATASSEIIPQALSGHGIETDSVKTTAPIETETLKNTSPTETVDTKITTQVADVAPIQATHINNGTGTVIKGKNGSTTILTQSANGALANIILNTEDNRTITQTMNIDLVLRDIGATLGATGSALKGANIPSGLNRAARMHNIGFGF